MDSGQDTTIRERSACDACLRELPERYLRNHDTLEVACGQTCAETIAPMRGKAWELVMGPRSRPTIVEEVMLPRSA
jgi:hypothetical protein